MNVSLIDSLQQTSFDSQMCLIKRGNRMKRVHVDGHRLAYYRVTESKTPHKTLHYAGFSARFRL